MITNVNSLASCKIIEIGMPCTINYWSDCRPAEIVDIQRDGKSIFVREMNHRAISGDIHKGNVEYKYTSNPNLPVTEYTLRKNGRYYPKGCAMKNGNPLSIGFARYYYDPSF